VVQPGIQRPRRKGEADGRPGRRTKLYEQAQVVFKKEAPWATLDHSVVVMPMSKKVSGYVMSPLGHHPSRASTSPSKAASTHQADNTYTGRAAMRGPFSVRTPCCRLHL
jgi:hypothetical protein